jgi:phosphoglycerate dehydrogenase-like enzyme
MSARERPLLVIPGDDPVQIAGSPRLDTLGEHYEIRLFDNRPADDSEKVQRAAGATAMINSRGAVTWPGEVLRQLPELKFISTCGIGTDSIDLVACGELGITVSNIPGRTAPVVAEHAFALMLAISRKTSYFTEAIKRNDWHQVLSTSLAGKTLGVIGTGNIGTEMIRLSRAFGMEVMAWTFHPDAEKAARMGFRYVERDELFAGSDVVSLHVKLTDDSRHLVSSRELSLMPAGSLLVNTARGAVLDTEALVEALDSGHLGGAALDVYETEPLEADHPLTRCRHVVLTPHCADQTPEGNDLLNLGATENAITFLSGQPQNIVS